MSVESSGIDAPCPLQVVCGDWLVLHKARCSADGASCKAVVRTPCVKATQESPLLYNWQLRHGVLEQKCPKP